MALDMPIAVVGMGCRLPGESSNPDKLWQVLSEGKSCYSKVPPDRFNVDAYRHPTNKIGTILPDGAHFLGEDVGLFDASFFNISPGDARSMDPQQRLLLEVVYEALENAGLRMESLAGSDTSCHVGCFTRDWTDLLMRDPEAAPKYSITGVGFGMQANRVSWFFDWHGPSLTLDTACSSSLVALHLACQSIRQGDAKVAVSAGTNLILNPDLPMWMSNMSFLSKDGKSKSFDVGADGYGRGEGVGVVVLKSLGDALRDNDCIRAVIRSTGTNHDGHTSGITLPSSDAQIDLIRSVYAKASLSYDDTAYFEAHGTGTRAGDETELRAITETVAKHRDPHRKLYVGSIKSNIGHTEGTAGIASLIKTVLMLEKGLITPNVPLNAPNPKMLLEESNLRLPMSLTPWPSRGVRRVSISSFGYGGTNAHAIVDDAASCLVLDGSPNIRYGGVGDGLSSPGSHTSSSGVLLDSSGVTDADSSGGDDPISGPLQRLLAFSAHEKLAVGAMEARYSEHLKRLLADGDLEGPVADPHYLDKLAHTLGARRSRLPWRSFVVAESLKQVVEALISGDTKPKRCLTKPRIGFVFTGQGAQWAGMGRELLGYAKFGESVREADEYLRSTLECEWSVLEELTRDAKSSQIGLAKYSQPLCTILQVALIELLQSWGITPVAVVGHSSGEIAAALCAGAITREVAWKIAFWRGKLSSDTALRHPTLKGAMLAAGASPEQVQPYLEHVTSGRIQIACVNSPESVTLSGDETGIDEMQALLKADGLFARKLVVENAYHSYHMNHIADEYAHAINDCAGTCNESKTGVLMASSVTGAILDLKNLPQSYWVQNLTSPVQFSDAMGTLLRGGSARRRRRQAGCAIDFLLEIGPHSALKGPVSQILKKEGLKSVAYASALKRGDNAVTTTLHAVGSLFSHGVDVDMDSVNQTGSSGKPTPVVDLPTYPWNHAKAYWAESRISKAYRFRDRPRVDLLGAPVADAVQGDPAWRQFLRTSELPWIRDHKIQSSILYPAAGMICMVLEAARQLVDVNKELDHLELRHVRFDRPMIIPDDAAGVETKLQLFRPGTNAMAKDWYEFRLYSGSGDSSLELNCCGYVSLRYASTSSWSKHCCEEAKVAGETFRQTLAEKESKCTVPVSSSRFYSHADKVGLQYGPCFQNLTNIHHGGRSACATLVVHDTKASIAEKHEDPHLLHPTTLDCMFQLLFAGLNDGGGAPEAAAVPFFIEGLKVRADCPREAGHGLRGFSEVSLLGTTEYVADIAFGDENCSGPVVDISGIRCKIVEYDAQGATASATIGERYGFLRTVPYLQLNSPGGLLRYFKKRGEDEPSKALSVLDHIIELTLHAEPHAAILELSDGRTSALVDILASLSTSMPHSFTSVNWTVANLESDVREILATKGTEFGANIAFNTIELSPALADSSADHTKYDAILISGRNAANLDAEKLEFIKTILKTTGHVITTFSDSGPGVPSSSPLISSAFDRIIEIPSSGQSEVGASGQVIVAATPSYHELLLAKAPVFLLLPHEPSELCRALASEITWDLGSHGIPVQRRLLQRKSMEDCFGTWCISLLELEHPLGLDSDPENFRMCQELMLQTKRLLWVAGTSDPRLSLMTGIMRTARNENPSLDLISLALEPVAPRAMLDTAHLIAEVFVANLDDMEFILEDGVCCVPRYAPDKALNWNIGTQQDKKSKELVTLGEAVIDLQLAIRKPGQLDTMVFKLDPGLQLDLLPDEVEIETCAVGITAHDIMTLMGEIPDPVLGREASGVVRRVGSAVNKFKTGDRVFHIGSGCFKTRLRARENLCQHIPQDMTFSAAASVPVAFCTALGSIRDLARLQRGETILIHAAADSNGHAAIQFAQFLEAEVFVTVESSLEQQTLCEVHGIPEDHVFSCLDTSFVQGIKRMTNGRGVDVVLNSLHGDMLVQTWHCIASFGRFIDISVKGLSQGTSLDTTPFKTGATFTCFDIDLMLKENPERLSALMCDVTGMLRQGLLLHPKQTVTQVTATDMFSDPSFTHLGERANKTVVTISPQDKVPVHPSAWNVLRLREDSTYLIVGGLGGLGRSQALHMARCGAKYLAFFSRSGPADSKATSLCEELKRLGTHGAAYACDVADAGQLEAALKRCAKELPPIRGCIQGAMVLRDGIFETMTYDDFRDSLRPKVQGSWNLHQQLPRDLDFFILLSSISGVTGNPGQANYAAGNTFMDALAHHRRRQGLSATSIDLGLILDVGFVAEREGTSNLKKWESAGLAETEYLLLVSAAIRGVLPASAQGPRYALPTQIITGLATGGHVAARSLDEPFYFSDARFKHLVKAEVSEGLLDDAAGEAVSLQQSLAASTSTAQAAEIIGEAVRHRLARVMEKNPENIDLGKPFHAYGVDSLMAVEVRNWLAKEMRCNVGLFDVMGSAGIGDLAIKIAGMSKLVPKFID